MRDLRVGGGRAITDIHVVCAVRKSEGSSPEISDFGSGSRDRGDGSPSTRLGGTLRLRAGGGDRFERGGGDNARDVPRLAAFRAFLGEIAIGPWRKGTPEAFGIIEGLRATEVAFSEGSGDDMGADDGDVTVDLSLEWEIETNGGSERYVDAATRMTRHCDLWRLCSNEPGGVEEWQWLGRAYGRKYRLRGLRLGRGRQGWDEGSAEETEEDASLSLAVQQVNGMGYRQVGYACICCHSCNPRALRWKRSECVLIRTPAVGDLACTALPDLSLFAACTASRMWITSQSRDLC